MISHIFATTTLHNYRNISDFHNLNKELYDHSFVSKYLIFEASCRKLNLDKNEIESSLLAVYRQSSHEAVEYEDPSILLASDSQPIS